MHLLADTKANGASCALEATKGVSDLQPQGLRRTTTWKPQRVSLSFYSGLGRALLPQHWVENSLEHVAICLKGKPAAGTSLILNLTLLPADKTKTPPSRNCYDPGRSRQEMPVLGEGGTNGSPVLGQRTIKGCSPPAAAWEGSA